MSIQYPDINGNRFSFASVAATTMPTPGGVAGAPLAMLGFKEVSYSSSKEPGMVYGTSSKPLGRTRGQAKYEASMTMYKKEADAFLATLGDGFMDVPFLLLVQYAEGTDPIQTDQIIGCKITKHEDTASGTDALAVKFTLSVMDIKYNGRLPVV